MSSKSLMQPPSESKSREEEESPASLLGEEEEEATEQMLPHGVEEHKGAWRPKRKGVTIKHVKLIGHQLVKKGFEQVGVAAWLECWLSHLGVAGLSPGRDNL